MRTRVLSYDGHRAPEEIAIFERSTAPSSPGWTWIDVVIEQRGDQVLELDVLAELDLDAIALHDAVHEDNLPKIDDFGNHLHAVLHGLRRDRIATYEVDCFVIGDVLVTFREGDSVTIDTLWSMVQTQVELAGDGCSELLARIADGLSRRLLGVVDAFDARADDLIAAALRADPDFLADVTAVRADLAKVRRAVIPQREVLDLLRVSDSPHIGDSARRRFSDVFDVSARTAVGLDTARSALSEALDAYRGAEARQATEVTKVLTVYAAVVLPLSLIAGFFGMNHTNLPTINSRWGWVVVAAVMLGVAAISIGVFVAEGWVKRPSGRRAGATLGRGLLEAARAPAQVVGAVYEISSLPVRTAFERHTKNDHE